MPLAKSLLTFHPFRLILITLIHVFLGDSLTELPPTSNLHHFLVRNSLSVFLYKAALLFFIILYYSLMLLHVSLVQSIPMFYNTNLKEHERDWINLPFGLKFHFLEKVIFCWMRYVIWDRRIIGSPAMTRGVLGIKIIFSFCPSVGKFSWNWHISFLWYIVWY